MTTAFATLAVFLALVVAVTCHQNHHQQQNYQQVVNHQQQQAQNQQFQQPNAQYQQQPQAGQPVPQQQQQQQQQQQTNGHGGAHDPQILANANMDHVLEHLEGVINKPKEQMTLEEQNFYYFKLHDYNNDNMLDGLELVSAFAHNDEHKDEDAHQHPDGQAAQNATKEPEKKSRISDEELIKLIDDIMNDEDKNQDGYITYQEFLHAIKHN